MTGEWNKTDPATFKRDLLRDFCLSADSLEEQFARFERSGNLSFALISEIMGGETSKGLLWRTKDLAHRLSADTPAAARHLDWAIGFLFHECMNLLESAYQEQYYAPRLAEWAPPPAKDGQGPESALRQLAAQNRQSLPMRIDRARRLIAAACEFFCRYLEGETENRPLARLIYEREKLLRRVFKAAFPGLLNAVYGQTREALFVEAALSLAETGRWGEAEQAAQKALKTNKNCKKTAELLELIAKPPSADFESKKPLASAF